ncbi:MAG: hypothetical protein KGZ74_03010 [Chitinophagaceae bacterium]|nr:hypothetical protein [Chitinophagaceae bacterium]
MRALIIPLILLFTAIQGYSQKTIPLKDAAKHIGDSVTVCANVSGGRFLDYQQYTLPVGIPLQGVLFLVITGCVKESIFSLRNVIH